MRDVEVWDLSDLTSLIDNKVQEHLRLDYKRSTALTNAGAKKDIAKDVSAFANSAGGTIVYGIVEEGHVPTDIDDGLDPGIISKEWLEQVINSNIEPRIAGIIIRPIPLNNGRTAYAVNIPQATTFAPHQATTDNRYYKRFNFLSVPMQDYEVRDVLGRASVGHPFIKFSLTKTTEAEGVATLSIRAIISNYSSEPVLYCTMKFIIDVRLYNQPKAFWDSNFMADIETMYGNKAMPSRMYGKNMSIPGDMPLYKEVTYNIGTIDITVPLGSREIYVFGYSISSPGFSYDGYGAILVSRDKIEEVGTPPLGLFQA